jgi:hypothetical protein
MNAQTTPDTHLVGPTSLRSLLRHRAVRTSLTLGAAMAGIACAVVAAAIAYNAFDDELSPQARALLAPPPMGKIEERNGLIAFLGLAAPVDQDPVQWGRAAAAAFAAQAQAGFTPTDAWKQATRDHLGIKARTWCKPDCVTEARRDSAAVRARLADGKNALLLARYRKIAEAPEFADLYVGGLTVAPPGSYSLLAAGASLALSEAATQAASANPGAFVGALEREMRLHRRMASAGGALATVLNGENLLASDLLALSSALRADPEGLAPYLARLRRSTRPDIDVAGTLAALRLHSHQMVSWSLQWKQLLRESGGLPTAEHGSAPLANWGMGLFIQPHATANLVANVITADAALAAVPADRLEREMAATRKSKDTLLARPWYAQAANPVGKDVAQLNTSSLGKYAARLHDVRALLRMVDLQLALAHAGINEPGAVAVFIAGHAGGTQDDPYTGKPFAFDAATRQLSFQPRADSPWNAQSRSRHAGRVVIDI